MKDIRLIILNESRVSVTVDALASYFSTIIKEYSTAINEFLSQDILPCVIHAEDEFYRDHGQFIPLVVSSCVAEMDKIDQIAATSDSDILGLTKDYDEVKDLRCLFNFSETGAIFECKHEYFPDSKFTILSYGRRVQMEDFVESLSFGRRLNG